MPRPAPASEQPGPGPGPRRLLARTIVGREAELIELAELLEAPAATTGVVQVAGEAGIGKTRTARAAADQARARGRLLLEGRARPTDASLPLGVFQDALRADRRARPDAPAPSDPLAAAFPSRLLPELGGTPEDIGGGRAALFEAACSYLNSLAEPPGLLLILEDLHWADPSSHALIRYLAETARRDRLLVLVTYRSEEVSAGTSLAELCRELRRERLGVEIVLSPLAEPAIADMLESMLDAPADPLTVQALYRVSGGNPFLVEEFAREAVDEGQLDPETGRWMGKDRVGLPPSVSEMLLARVRRLPAADQELLRWASVIGERLEIPLLTAASGFPEDDVVAALGRLADGGLVVEDPTDARGLRFGFRHALTREAVLAQLLTAERRRRHARVLESSEAQYEGTPDAPLEFLAHHALAAGERRKGFTYSARAARHSIELCGYAEAETHLRRALELWGPEDGREHRAELLLNLGRLLGRVTLDRRASGVLQEARREFIACGNRVRAALALAAHASGRVHAGDRADVVSDLRTARSELREDDPLEAHLEVLPLLADALQRAGSLRAAAESATEGLRLVPATPSRPEGVSKARLLIAFGTATWLGGDPAGGRAALIDALEVARAHGDHLGVARACFELACTHLNGLAVEAARWAEEGLALAREREVHLSQAWLYGVRALIHVKAGEWEAAERLLDAADREVSHLGSDPVSRLGFQWVRGERWLGLGAVREALAVIEAAVEETDALGDLQVTSWVRLGLARAHLAGGDTVRAREALEPAIAAWQNAPEGGLPTPPSLLLAGLEIAASGRDAAGAEEFAAELQRRVHDARARYARALAQAASARRPEAGAVEAAAREIEDAGWGADAARMRLVAAQALAQSPAAREEAIACARAALESLRRLKSEGCCRAAEGVLRALGARRGPRSSGAAHGLTPRELEVLSSLCEGLSNRRIAERLIISESTTVRHVANIFGKLGVHSRAHAVRVAADLGLLNQPPTA